MKQVTLCADDFGMHPDVSEAIARLAGKGRIQATSALITAAACRQDASLILPLRDQLDIGLHVNFTEGSGLTKPFHRGLPGLASMLWKSHCRLLSMDLLKNEIRAQLDTFTSIFGFTPDFIDGHQHVHHLPQVRKALLSVLNEQYCADLWIRSVSPMVQQGSWLKSKIIEHSGAGTLKAQLAHSEWRNNNGFAGVYSLSEKEPFDQLMRYWLQHLPSGGLIMCHPATGSENAIDHLPARRQELRYLESSAFLRALRDTSVKLNRLSLSGN